MKTAQERTFQAPLPMIVFRNMKTLLKLGAVVIVLLSVLTACNLNQISVQWAITSVATSGSFYTINYDIWNDGKYDLKGVNLTFSVHSPSGYLYVKSPDFSLAQGETISGNQITVNVAPDLASQVDLVEVVGVNMDKPD
ncbi:MAG TPA: hypothetical protein VFB30_12375 [Spirochaetia bacterium]|nr:hypothetical protein [Spirochaetia bacterium]